MRIIFFGTSSFAARLLEYLLQEGVSIVAVVTRPDRPQGRNLTLSPPPVKEFLLKNHPNIPLLQPVRASTPECAAQLQAFSPDLFVVAAYGEIIKRNILDLPRKGCINVHTSLLPKYRGAAPMQRALMDGVRVTGVTIIEMNEQMDAGDILDTAEVVAEGLTLGELEEKLFEAGAPLLLRVIRAIQKGSAVKKPQNHAQATLAPKILPQETQIDWNRPAAALYNQIRALSPQPAAWCWIEMGGERKRLKIKMSALEEERSGEPGEILEYTSSGWIVACGEGALRLLEVQLEGKKSLPAKVFIQGMRSIPSLKNQTGL